MGHAGGTLAHRTRTAPSSHQVTRSDCSLTTHGDWQMDFDDDGSVTQVVGHELENLDVPWPPSTEGKTDRYLKQFEAATAIAEREVDETDDDEQGGEEEEEGEGEEDEEEAEAEAESEAKVEAADGKGGGKKSKKS